MPADLTASGISSSSIEIRWTAVERATDYDVQRRAEGGGDVGWVALAAVEHTPDPVYRDGGLAADTGYEYRVRATFPYLDKVLRSAWTGPASARTDP